MAGHAQITQSNKFAISLQYLKEVNDEFDFLCADQLESFLQNDILIFDGHGQVFSKHSQTPN